jgi:ABC-type sugar transport system permease subunit
MIMPVVGFVFIKQVIAVSQIYQNILMMTGGGPYMATTSIVYLVYKEAFVAGRYGRAAAESMVLLLMVLTISIIQAKYFFWRKK